MSSVVLAVASTEDGANGNNSLDFSLLDSRNDVVSRKQESARMVVWHGKPGTLAILRLACRGMGIDALGGSADLRLCPQLTPVAEVSGSLDERDANLHLLEVSPEVRDLASSAQWDIDAASIVVLPSEAEGREQEGDIGDGERTNAQDGALSLTDGRRVEDGAPRDDQLAGSPGVCSTSCSEPGIATRADIERLICSYDWPCGEALRIARCESGLAASAYSQGNYGLFQVNSVHRARVQGDLARLYDARVNTQVAYDIWRDNHGWGPWACKP